MNLIIWQEDHPTIHGGAETWLISTAKGLGLLGHSVSWLQDGGIAQAVKDTKADAVILGTIQNFIGLHKAKWLIDNQVPTALMLHDYWPFCPSRMLMQDSNRSDQQCEATKGVCGNSCGGQREALRDIVLDFVNRFYVVTGCEGAAEIMRRNGINVQAVVEEGIDTDLFKPADKRPVIMAHAAGRDMWKGMHLLEQAAKGLPLEIITGKDRAEVAEMLSHAAVYAFPSVYEEIWGLALTEAMASGCACVAFDVAGARAQLHEDMGHILPYTDYRSLHWHLGWLLGDEPMCDIYGQVARAHVVEDHSLLALGKRWERTLEGLIRRGDGTHRRPI